MREKIRKSETGSSPRFSRNCRADFWILLLFLFSTSVIHAQVTTQTVFPSSKIANDSGPEGNDYELGLVFRANTPGTISAVRVYSLASETGNHFVRIWRNADNALLAGPFTWNYGGVSGWRNYPIPPLSIAANQDYTVSVSTGEGGKNYPFLSSDLSLAGGNGQNLFYQPGAGVFTTALGTQPRQSFQNANYFRDIVFTPETSPLPTNGPVVITEIMADNESGLQDEDGDFSDWIEIYNSAATNVNLAGCQLSDSGASWVFPAFNLGAKQFLVVFASGKNRSTTNAPLHTNFKLDKDGEYLALKNADGVVLSEFAPAFPPQRTDYSSGFGTNREVVFFYVPTPNAVNSRSFDGFVADIAFNVKRGFFDAPVEVSITNFTPGATIHYTLNGSEPTETNAIYTNSFFITNTTTLRAAAFKTNFLPTKIHTGTYIFLQDVLQQTPETAQAYGWPVGPINGQILRYGLNPLLTAQYSTAQMLAALKQIPSMSIVTEQRNLTHPVTGIYVNGEGDGAAWERPVSLELINPDGSPGFQEDCGLRIRGGQSRAGNFPKHSFHVNFRKQYGAGKLKFPLFGPNAAQEFDTFDLRCEHGYAYADPYTFGTEFTSVRDVFCRDLWGATGYASTRSRYYHLYINGQYWGLYQSQERPEENYGATYFDGDEDEYDVIKATGLPQTVIELSNGNYTNWTKLWQGTRSIFANGSTSNYFALQGRNPNGTRNPSLPVLFDPRELAAYMLLHYYCGHSDEPLSVSFNWERPNNFRAMRRQGLDQPFHFFVHDAESSVAVSQWVDNRANAGNLSSPNRNQFQFSNPEWMHEDLLSNAEYRIAFADEAQRLLFNDGVFTPAKSQPYFETNVARITEAVIGESIRWGKESNHNQASWQAEINRIRSDFFPTRTTRVIAQLRQRNLFPSVNAPIFSQRGGRVSPSFQLTLSTTNSGTIYFTTNGTDPRAIGGGISGSAALEPITINSPTRVRARLRAASGEWSALDAATFTTFVPASSNNLVVSEFNYHPTDPSAAEKALGYADDSAFEFIELLNISANGCDLSGVKITQGVTFDFAGAPLNARFLEPGSRVVVVANSAGFSSRLAAGAAPLIAGTYAGVLKNSGETLTLVDASNAVIKSFSYSDSAPWPKDADGDGRSLVLNNPVTNPNHALASSWRPSAQINGAPGAVDSAVLPIDLFGDDDGNGFSNLYDYATGASGKLSLTSELFTPTSGVAANYFYFRHPRSLLADNVNFIIESSTDLVSWTPMALVYVSTVLNSGSSATATYRSAQSVDEIGQTFFVRFKVQP